jgi:hypothetical protein
MNENERFYWIWNIMLCFWIIVASLQLATNDVGWSLISGMFIMFSLFQVYNRIGVL